MLGRRAVLVACVAATTFGGGAAYAAVHGSSQHARNPKPAAKLGPASNVHYPCRHHGSGSIAGLV